MLRFVLCFAASLIFFSNFDILGQGKGFDIDLIKLISDAVSIPVIASSGAGAVKHFSEVFNETNASAALAAGIFHRKEVKLTSSQIHSAYMIMVREYSY